MPEESGELLRERVTDDREFDIEKDVSSKRYNEIINYSYEKK